ncbi:tetratricopeptide repeat protein [Sulfitobacter mediterraneus]|uniref:tetratricopeptide repeat protein n=1 Tax=Sulfitobacter mediterraneus TaxID=83219 RepID=UPI0019341D0C|nr:tetratricopeptide repeat protein [Sulfitobacter mediterraneus]MBM1633978.1 tetratricopeptide repeat protein [Sulfitobacter mediterraneus]MBM1641506.1 tetratricopeptide repeat protein [Sulfitobacter mediterraneus]MBM1645843.1 tetratricopeptide repeat protein [Sulfitobacter mediterraneus]MBM1649626.1 tetratricopeptide repeat protein [Sulfitobacter mediterraneus]MBM1653912.1 tetratricopeptide repeat protein [Sulfitobacter mediterraneus]
MLTDSYGNQITVTSQAALDQYDLGVRQFLAADFGAAEAFQTAVDQDEGFALGHVGLARALMMSGQMPAAKAAMARAQTLAARLDTRQRQHVECFALLFAGQPHKARAMVKSHVRAYPRDALAAQLCANVFGLIGFSGEVGREAELLAYTSALLPHYGEDWWMMSMHALSLCETGQIDASMQLMDKSLALNARNANAAHFKSHAQYEAGDAAAGRRYLADWLVDYDDRAVLHGHLSWHAALWALHDGDAEGMWAAIDAGVGPQAAKGLPINVLTDTAAIFYRAELAGLPVAPKRWSELSEYATQFFPETGQSFADMHAALAHAMAGNADRLAYICDTAKGFAGDLVQPVARAWGAIARQDWQAALEELVMVMGTTERLGGSRAQRDLLELTYANVLLKLGLTEEARRSLTTRRPVLAAAPPIAGFGA